MILKMCVRSFVVISREGTCEKIAFQKIKIRIFVHSKTSAASWFFFLVRIAGGRSPRATGHPCIAGGSNDGDFFKNDIKSCTSGLIGRPHGELKHRFRLDVTDDVVSEVNENAFGSDQENTFKEPQINAEGFCQFFEELVDSQNLQVKCAIKIFVVAVFATDIHGDLGRYGNGVQTIKESNAITGSAKLHGIFSGQSEHVTAVKVAK